ncbi:MAG: VWA domain-containing protein [Ignisphaera sp.]|uniref:VWA domain-containing protein n=1 Tax=Ignisphaera aggregans TaxID=334771 RepID=A0A7J3MZX9_9CREN
MPVSVESRLGRHYIVEDKSEAVPFLIRFRCSEKFASTSSLYSVAIDASWSMDGAKIFRAKEAVLKMLKNLPSTDYINIYSFNDRTKLVYSGRVSEYNKALSSVLDIRLGGGTNIYGLLKHVYSNYLNMRSEGINSHKLIVITDGIPTTGTRSSSKIIDIARRLGEHVSASVIVCVGDDCNDKLLMDIATSTKGVLEVLDDADKLIPVVEKLAHRYRNICAKNVKMYVKSTPTSSIYIYNRSLKPTENGLEISVGDIYTYDRIDIAGEVVVPPQRSGNIYLATISIEYTDIDSEHRELPPITLSIPCLSNQTTSEPAIDATIYREVNLVKMASMIVKDLYKNLTITDAQKIITEFTEKTKTATSNTEDLYAKTIDLREHLESEGLSPEAIKKLMSLLSRILTGRMY